MSSPGGIPPQKNPILVECPTLLDTVNLDNLEN